MTAERPFSLPRWVGFVVVGESVGFLIPLSGFALTWWLGLAPWAGWLLAVCLGLGEGAVLGLAQARALVGTAVEVPVRRWVAVTALAAALAWSIGMAPSTLIESGVEIDVGRPLTWAAFGGGGLILLLTIPAAQWTVLRQVLARAWRWVPLNVVAWLVGLTFTLLPSPFVDESTPPAQLAVLFALGGVAMAAVVAVVTGLGLRRMLGAGRPGAGRPGAGQDGMVDGAPSL